MWTTSIYSMGPVSGSKSEEAAIQYFTVLNHAGFNLCRDVARQKIIGWPYW